MQKNNNDFQKAIKVLGEYLTTVAIIKHAKTKIYLLDKIINKKTIKIANKVHIYYFPNLPFFSPSVILIGRCKAGWSNW